MQAILVISLYYNLKLWLSQWNSTSHPVIAGVPLSIRSTLQTPHTNLTHLVMVPGHAIWLGHDPTRATNDSEWILEKFQMGGDVRTYIRHITKGAEIAVQDPNALLIFSGGMTRLRSDYSEAMSYAKLAKSANLYAQFVLPTPDLSAAAIFDFERVTTEDYALDSFQNVQFSIARFKEMVGHFPSHITVVGYGMKRRRYEQVHRAALRWPASGFNYISIDNDHDVAADYDAELHGGLEPYLKDCYGCKGKLLAKRKLRNVFHRFHPYHISSPELRDLFEYCPKDNSIFEGPLPWD